jgi:hypothetical protein
VILTSEQFQQYRPVNPEPPMSLPNAIATCSCGLKTHVTFVGDPTSETSSYMPCIKPWQFRTEPGTEKLKVGWYCGKDGHEQREYIELATFPMIEERPGE